VRGIRGFLVTESGIMYAKIMLIKEAGFPQVRPTPKACLGPSAGLPKRPGSEDHWEEDDFTPVGAIVVLLHRLKIFCSIFTMTEPIDPLQDRTLNISSLREIDYGKAPA
jgi:hypothetical protein